MKFALTVLGLFVSVLAIHAANASPAVCLKYPAVIHASDSPHGIGADVEIQVNADDAVPGGSYTYTHTTITGAIEVDCDGVFSPGDKTVCGTWVVDSVGSEQSCY